MSVTGQTFIRPERVRMIAVQAAPVRVFTARPKRDRYAATLAAIDALIAEVAA